MDVGVLYCEQKLYAEMDGHALRLYSGLAGFCKTLIISFAEEDDPLTLVTCDGYEVISLLLQTTGQRGSVSFLPKILDIVCTKAALPAAIKRIPRYCLAYLKTKQSENYPIANYQSQHTRSRIPR
jgi:hypothetical protein